MIEERLERKDLLSKKNDIKWFTGFRTQNLTLKKKKKTSYTRK